MKTKLPPEVALNDAANKARMDEEFRKKFDAALAEEPAILDDLETASGEPVASAGRNGFGEPAVLSDLEPTSEAVDGMVEPPDKTMISGLETVLGEPVSGSAPAAEPPVMPELDSVADELIGLIDAELSGQDPNFKPETVKPAPIELDATDIFADPGRSSGEDIASFLTDVRTEDERDGFRIILTVGSHVIDGVKVCIGGVDEQGKRTADQQGAVFKLSPGEYNVMIRDQGMEVTRKIRVTPGVKETRIDLQSIH